MRYLNMTGNARGLIVVKWIEAISVEADKNRILIYTSGRSIPFNLDFNYKADMDVALNDIFAAIREEK